MLIHMNTIVFTGLSLKSSSFHDNSKRGLGMVRTYNENWSTPLPNPSDWPLVYNISQFRTCQHSPLTNNLCMRKGKLATGLHGSFDACINLYKTPASLKPAFWNVLGLVLWKIIVYYYTHPMLWKERWTGEPAELLAQMYFPRQFTFSCDYIWKTTTWKLIPLKLSMPTSPLKVFWYIQGPGTQGEHCLSAPVTGSQGIKQGHERGNLTPTGCQVSTCPTGSL